MYVCYIFQTFTVIKTVLKNELIEMLQTDCLCQILRCFLPRSA